MTEWRDIATAPRDGTRFKAKGNDWGRATGRAHRLNVLWDFDRKSFVSVSDPDQIMEYLTHWKPLPHNGIEP